MATAGVVPVWRLQDLRLHGGICLESSRCAGVSFSDAEVKNEKTACRHCNTEQEPEYDREDGVTDPDIFGDNRSPEIEQNVQQDGIVDAAALFADISEDHAETCGVDSLHHVHMEDAEENCLNQIGSPEGKAF